MLGVRRRARYTLGYLLQLELEAAERRRAAEGDVGEKPKMYGILLDGKEAEEDFILKDIQVQDALSGVERTSLMTSRPNPP